MSLLNGYNISTPGLSDDNTINAALWSYIIFVTGKIIVPIQIFCIISCWITNPNDTHRSDDLWPLTLTYHLLLKNVYHLMTLEVHIILRPSLKLVWTSLSGSYACLVMVYFGLVKYNLWDFDLNLLHRLLVIRTTFYQLWTSYNFTFLSTRQTDRQTDGRTDRVQFRHSWK